MVITQEIINKFVAEFCNQPVSYYVAQFFGLLVTAGVIANMQLKKRLHMLTLSVFINLFSATNILLLKGEINSGAIVCFVAIAQLILSIIHEIRNTRVTLAEKLIFLVLYVAGGVFGLYLTGGVEGIIKQPLDMLTIIAAVFYMIAMFQKNEQHIRLILLLNLSCWLIYLLFPFSFSIFGQIAGIISSLIGLYRYRKSNKKIKQ